MRTLRISATVAATLLLASPLGAVARRMFVTSVSGTANLSSWADAGGHTGLAAGDAICRARAAAGGLPNAAGYRAWLSDSADDAYCRLHDLTGKKSALCGQPTLPAAAGPWLRVDGAPFGADITHLLEPDFQVLMPPRLSESGAVVHDRTWTGTGADGASDDVDCGGWTSAAAGVYPTVGCTDATSGGWGGCGSLACAGAARLLCLETGVGDPLPRIAGWGRLAFVTSAMGNGDLGSWPGAGGQTGLAAGDAVCRSLASAAGLPNPTSFKAWLSTAASDARDRFLSDGPWMRLDRARLAAGIADLTDGDLATALNLTETGVYLGGYGVWTGTGSDGTAWPDRCGDWTSDATGVDGLLAIAYAADAGWTDYYSSACDFSSSRLYCLQDLPLLFGDGFESGNAAVWSAAVP